MVAAIDSVTSTQAVSPPATGKYVAIKRFLTGAYELSEIERAATLLNPQGLCDSTPNAIPPRWAYAVFFFLHLFIQQLPDYVSDPLSISGIKDYRALSQETDGIYLSGRQRIQEVNRTK